MSGRTGKWLKSAKAIVRKERGTHERSGKQVRVECWGHEHATARMEWRARRTRKDEPCAGGYKGGRRGAVGAVRCAIRASAFGWWGECGCDRELVAWRRKSSAGRGREEDCVRGRATGGDFGRVTRAVGLVCMRCAMTGLWDTGVVIPTLRRSDSKCVMFCEKLWKWQPEGEDARFSGE